MTTATLSRTLEGTRGIDRLALRVGSALVLWAARRAERRTLTPEQRSHRIALERLESERGAAAHRARIGR